MNTATNEISIHNVYSDLKIMLSFPKSKLVLRLKLVFRGLQAAVAEKLSRKPISVLFSYGTAEIKAISIVIVQM
jgi:hypothetical protein